MASHRKPRTPVLHSPASRRTAVGLGTAALASATLLSQSAQAAPGEPKQSIEEVRKKVDELYRQAGSATQKYNAAKERTEDQRTKVEGLLDEVAKRTDKLNEARRTLGTFATAQYRNGGMAPTATMLLAEDPQGYFDQSRVMDRMTSRQQEAVRDYRTAQESASDKRAEATTQLASLTDSQQQLRDSKQSVQSKLSQAQELLSELTEEERARLAAIEKKKEEEARRKAEELARQEAARRRQAEQAREEEKQQDGGDPTTPAPETPSAPDATKAQQAIDFARSQIGKPYVWGAGGPNSYDCSGLTQAAWKAAGVSLPRTTYDQVETGTRVAKADMVPGDLVFFYDDISHVGLYIGGGQMIHAPKPGTNVRIESVGNMPFHAGVRPA